MQLFDDDSLYRRPQIRSKIGNPSERKLDSLLAGLTRVALSKKFIAYHGRELNELVARGLDAGRSPAPPTGAVAARLEREAG